MRYEVNTKAGYKFVFRSVLEMEIDAEARSVFLQMPGLKYTVHGFTTIKGGGDFEPWGNCMEIIPPSGGSAPAIPFTVADGLIDVRADADPFRREEPVPVELVTTTFAPLDDILVGALADANAGDLTIDEARARNCGWRISPSDYSPIPSVGGSHHVGSQLN